MKQVCHNRRRKRLRRPLGAGAGPRRSHRLCQHARNDWPQCATGPGRRYPDPKASDETRKRLLATFIDVESTGTSTRGTEDFPSVTARFSLPSCRQESVVRPPNDPVSPKLAKSPI